MSSRLGWEVLIWPCKMESMGEERNIDNLNLWLCIWNVSLCTRKRDTNCFSLSMNSMKLKKRLEKDYPYYKSEYFANGQMR